MKKTLVSGLVAASFSLTAGIGAVQAKAPDAEAAKLGGELTAVGAIKAGNADGSIPEWKGGALFPQETKDFTYDYLENMRKEDPAKIEAEIKKFTKGNEQWLEPVVEITKANLAEHADMLTAGHKAMFDKYADYKIKVYPSVRVAFFPDEVNAATIANAKTATLEGTESVKNAKLGFPFPIPQSGAEPMWNHKMKFRGSAAIRYNNQAIVKPDGDYKISKLVEDVLFRYANLEESEGADSKELLMYLQEVKEPPRVAGQMILVHEYLQAGEGEGGRAAWLYNPGLGRVNRAPNVGYDNPSIGSDGEQFNDQIDMFNGALDRYDWKLVGRKEMYIPYNSFEINSPLHKYDDLIKPGHVNMDLARFEKHRVWVVDATVKDGVRHQFKRRTFYLDEDSWSVAAVDCYDNRDQLWKLQEAHLLTVPFVPTTTGSPELVYDLQSGRYFATAMTNEDTLSNWEVSFKSSDFSPGALKRKSKGK